MSDGARTVVRERTTELRPDETPTFGQLCDLERRGRLLGYRRGSFRGNTVAALVRRIKSLENAAIVAGLDVS